MKSFHSFLIFFGTPSGAGKGITKKAVTFAWLLFREAISLQIHNIDWLVNRYFLFVASALPRLHWLYIHFKRPFLHQFRLSIGIDLATDFVLLSIQRRLYSPDTRLRWFSVDRWFRLLFRRLLILRGRTDGLTKGSAVLLVEQFCELSDEFTFWLETSLLYFLVTLKYFQ